MANQFAKLQEFTAKQLAAIHNIYADKKVSRFESTEIGRNRTAIALQAAGVTVAEAIAKAGFGTTPAAAAANGHGPDVQDVLGNLRNAIEASTQPAPAAAAPPLTALETVDAAMLVARLGLSPVDAQAFMDGYARGLQTARPAKPAKSPKLAKPAGGARIPTATQQLLIDAALRPGGATAKELMDAAGWPAIAAKAVITNLAERFGYRAEFTARQGSEPGRHALVRKAG